MGKITGFMEFERSAPKYAPVGERLRHWHEFVLPPSEADSKVQAARCMDCGIPYCHTGCPVNNQIPDWNDLVYHSDWRQAAQNLHSTNNFPEVTGRICPAPCEAACTLNIDDVPVTIKGIEYAIADRAFAEGWVAPEPPETKTGKRIAVVGSGPAGLAAAQQLARAGHDVHVYERNAKPGGLLVYGIPDFKMEKGIIERRVKQMEAEGVTFHCNVDVGRTISAQELEATHDALLLAGGSEAPFDFFAKSPGRELDGIHYAMEFLPQQNRRVSGEVPPAITDAKNGGKEILAKDKHVVVIGGGDTGSDCIGTSFRQGAKSVTQLEIMPMPPEHENKAMTWPNWPLKLRVSTSQAEGAHVEYSVSTTGFSGERRQGGQAPLRAGRQQAAAGTGLGRRAAGRPRAARHGVFRPHRGGAGARSSGSRWSRAGASRGSTPTSATTRFPARRRSLPPATSAAGNRSSCGRSAKAARPRMPSTSS